MRRPPPVESVYTVTPHVSAPPAEPPARHLVDIRPDAPAPARTLARVMRWFEPDKGAVSYVPVGGVLARHIGIGVLVAVVSIVLRAPLLALVLTYLLVTAVAAAALLPNAAEEIRHQARVNTVRVTLVAFVLRIIMVMLQNRNPGDLAKSVGSEVSSGAASMAATWLPTIWICLVAGAALVWSTWLFRMWELHGNASTSFETTLRRSRRDDGYQM